MKASDFFTAL